MNEMESRFIDHVRSECDKHGVKLDLRPVNYLVVNRKFRCTGYFDSCERELVCATKFERHFETLVHEYAHMTQWLDDSCFEWKYDVQHYCGTKMEAWLMGENVRGYKKHVAGVRDLELDNEKRTVKIIKEFELPIDVDMYTKRANCYVLMHNRMLKTRTWPNAKLINQPGVLDSMSTKFDMQYDKNTKEVEKAFESHGY